jgi:hypothetical protein
MKVDEGKYSIAELVDWHRRKELVVNERYQRAGGLWPTPAKSYFIDTILRDFPFPKVYFYERLDMASKRPRREIVDGQQRLSTIFEFVANEFALTANAREFDGRRFDTLTNEQQQTFLSYAVAVDVIRNAEPSEILQMFRRMNAFTLPLNPAEKRHSEYFGRFKDWVNTILDRFGSIFIAWGVLTSRQIVRMADAELIADIALAIDQGIVSTSPGNLKKLYDKYDEQFPAYEVMNQQVSDTLQCISTDLSAVQGTYITRSHVFHSLACALLQHKYGLPRGQIDTGYTPNGRFFANRDRAVASLKVLAAAHEQKDTQIFREYVTAASEGGNRAAQRIIRIRWLLRALDGELA